MKVIVALSCTFARKILLSGVLLCLHGQVAAYDVSHVTPVPSFLAVAGLLQEEQVLQDRMEDDGVLSRIILHADHLRQNTTIWSEMLRTVVTGVPHRQGWRTLPAMGKADCHQLLSDVLVDGWEVGAMYAEEITFVGSGRGIGVHDTHSLLALQPLQIQLQDNGMLEVRRGLPD